ncbi:MAG: endonuclease III [Clostridia bacterium]|nr:endonuclease III [Clostridia bacterium]
MKKKEEAINIIEGLKKAYPDAICSLDFETPFQMMIAVMLSAQCTDERVNKTTPELFTKYGTAKKMAEAPLEEIEKIIHPCGFYKNKSKNAIAAAKVVLEKFQGEVPQTIEELITIPGVGRKSANVIMLEAFNSPVGIAVDTHAKRVSNRMGFSKETDPSKIEQDLLKVFPEKYLYDVNHLFVWHGRNYCDSRKPNCLNCPVNQYCDFYKKL